MKTTDVPQDDSMLGEHRRACYAIDENGDYVVVPSKGWEVEVVVNAQAMDEIKQKIEAVRQRVLRGELSPLAFHMERCMMNVSLLAANSGIWRWRVKRHFSPKVFSRLNDEILQRYANAMGMTVTALCDVPTAKDQGDTNDN
ncbi:MAG: hypothetical protein IME93_00770 [Proteobacteria bacterium]|nr:hypothetical protein [Pseudomonadota bacterium]